MSAAATELWRSRSNNQATITVSFNPPHDEATIRLNPSRPLRELVQLVSSALKARESNMKARSFVFIVLACLPDLAWAQQSLTVPAIEITPVPTSSGSAPAISAEPPPPIPVLSGNKIGLTRKEKRGVGYADQWSGNSEMPARGDDGSVVFMFGGTLPSVVCAPLYVCDVALQAGETVNDIDIGDAVRWKVTPASSGSGPDTITHVIVKPTDTGLVTNMLITTNRRIYSIKLVSREHDWMPSVSFAYPEDTRAKLAAFQQDRQHERECVHPGDRGECREPRFPVSAQRRQSQVEACPRLQQRGENLHRVPRLDFAWRSANAGSAWQWMAAFSPVRRRA